MATQAFPYGDYPEQVSTPYAMAYGKGRQQSPAPQVQPTQEPTGTSSQQSEYDEIARRARILNAQGLSSSEAKKLAEDDVRSEKEASIAKLRSDIAVRREADAYEKDFSNYKTEMASVDYQDLSNADAKINEINSKYSHIAGSHDPAMSKAFETISKNSLLRYQAAYNAVARRLPQGISVDAVLGEKGRPDQSLINAAMEGKLAQVTASKIAQAEGKAKAVLPYQKELIGARETAKEQEMEKGAGLKVQTAFGMIPAEVQKAKGVAEAVEPIKTREMAQRDIDKQKAAGTYEDPNAPKPQNIFSKSLSTFSGKPSATPLPSKTPQATTDATPAPTPMPLGDIFK